MTDRKDGLYYLEPFRPFPLLLIVCIPRSSPDVLDSIVIDPELSPLSVNLDMSEPLPLNTDV